jgi:hypothetical protein
MIAAFPVIQKHELELVFGFGVLEILELPTFEMAIRSR